MKLVISKSREGNGYYTKIQNDYNGKHTEKYLTLQLPKGTDVDYGLYDADGFLSTYEKRDGNVEFKLVITDLTQIQQFKETQNNTDNLFKDFDNSFKTESKIGEQIEIKSEDLPF